MACDDLIESLFYEQRGLYFALLSGFLFASQGLGANLLSAENISPWFMCFMYNVLNAFAIPWINWREAEQFTGKETVLLFAAGLFDIGNFGFALMAYSYTTLGNASAILLSKPLWCALCAAVFLGESFSILDAILIALDLLGVVLVSRPPFIFGSEVNESTPTNFLGSVCALLGAFCGGGQFVTIRSLTVRKSFDRYLLFLVKCTIGFPFFVVMVCVHHTGYETMRTVDQWSYLALACFSGIAASLFTYMALESRDAKTVSLLATVQVIVAYLLQSFIVQSKVDLLTIVGAILITVSPVAYIIKSVMIERCTSTNMNSPEI